MYTSLLVLSFLAMPQPARLRESEVTHLAFSPDGKTLTAAYFQHAMNRPGTDWYSFADSWDLTTGKALILPDAIGPVAYTPDGKVLSSMGSGLSQHGLSAARCNENADGIPPTGTRIMPFAPTK